MSEDKREMVDEQDDGTVKESRRDFLKKIGLAAAATAALQQPPPRP
ncbi:twin-arginine translocation signal domain-containing protein [Desulfobulbus sp. F1]|nr:twin-arginine translocation signal domain-containing protein [Desulfobulbus sp. F1]